MTLFKPGDVVKIVARSSGVPTHFYKVGAFVTLLARLPGERPLWNTEGPHPSKPGQFMRQTAQEVDFELVRPAVGPPAEEGDPAPDDREAAYWESLPVVALPPHPEEVPDVDSVPTDKAVLAPYYLQASDEDIRKAILNLQFELSQRAYRAPAVKEND